MMTIYTDGACEPNPGPGGWAAIIVNGEAEEKLVGFEPQTTNNRMEILAALSALEVVRPAVGDRIVVVTDSKYLANGASSWMAGWKRNGWKTKERSDVLNRDLWQRLDAAIQRHATQSVKIEWQWQRGHNGHQYNERCDALATSAAREQRVVDEVAPAKDVNEPHICLCGSGRFVKLLPFNKYCCELPTDPGPMPLMIQCGRCRQVFRQTGDWGWEAIDESEAFGPRPAA